MRAALYVRVSTTGQEEGTSLQTQEERCRTYAHERGYAVASVFRDIHTGSQYRERPALTQLRQIVRDRAVDVVVAYAVDRFSRNQAHLYILAEEIHDHGARLEFVTEDFENTPVGKFILSARAFAAEVEREKIAERSMRGKRARAQAGLPIGGGILPFGYRWRDAEHTGFDLDPITSVWVVQMFAWVAGGLTLRQVALRLNERGIPTPRKKGALWGHSTLHGILTNPTYMGQRAAFRFVQVMTPSGGRKMIERPVEEQIPLPASVAPALIDAETFAAVQARLRRNQEKARRNARYPVEAALLRGFVTCGHCGGSMTVKRVGVGPAGPYYHYRCIRGMTVSQRCTGASIPTHTLDPVVWERVESVLMRPDIIAAEVERLRTNDPTPGELESLDRMLRDLQGRQKNLIQHLALFSDPDAAVPVAAQIETLRAQERQVQNDREAILARRRDWELAEQHLNDLERWCGTVAEKLTRLTYEEKCVAMEALGVQARVWRAGSVPRYEITMTLPLAIVDESSARWGDHRRDLPCECRPGLD